ncbi:MAG: twin-arginine translocation signal domain-containing protein, partial [Candidatus Oleimicrobiaceae bacterium]
MEEQMLSRRQFLTLVGSSAAVGLLAACAPAAPMAQPAGEPAQAAEAATAAKGKVRLAFWVEWQQPFYEEFLKAFNEEYDDMQLEFVVVEGLGGDSSGKFMAAVAGGNPPDALLAWADSLP